MKIITGAVDLSTGFRSLNFNILSDIIFELVLNGWVIHSQVIHRVGEN